jgi:hypothetical protein
VDAPRGDRSRDATNCRESTLERPQRAQHLLPAQAVVETVVDAALISPTQSTVPCDLTARRRASTHPTLSAHQWSLALPGSPLSGPRQPTRVPGMDPLAIFFLSYITLTRAVQRLHIARFRLDELNRERI